MIFGISILTVVHVAISIVGIATGFVVMWGLFVRKKLDKWTLVFLASTIATSATGFLFPIEHMTPGIAIGILSLVTLAVAILARYQFHFAGPWRWIYLVSAVIAQYFDVFVLFVQLFLKVPALHDLAPTQTEFPYLLTQSVVLLSFVAFTIIVGIRYRGNTLRLA
jgi:hypothetical protein